MCTVLYGNLFFHVGKSMHFLAGEKNFTLCIVVMQMLLLFPAITMAGKFEDSARSFVYVDMVPNITVNVISGNLALDNMLGGQVTGNLIFSVSSNVSRLTLSADATKLYKGGSLGSEAQPIDLDIAQPIHINIEQGFPLNGANNEAMCTLPKTIATPQGMMDGYQCAGIEFESSQIWRFSQNVAVELHWQQNNTVQPVGQYSGYVILHAAIVD